MSATQTLFYSMHISYHWLSHYLPSKIELEKLSPILTDVGLEVEGIKTMETVPGQMKGFKIGKVLTCEQHPNADRLKVTTVDIGDKEPVQIVCGAPNVAAGQQVVVATVGSTIYPEGHDPFQIKKAKLRGEESHGMICSGKEIGWNDDEDGIMVLPETATVGQDAAEYFELGDTDIQIEIGLTPNRSDAFSHLGVAKDVVAYWRYHHDANWALKMPQTSLVSDFKGEKSIDIEVKDTERCLYYSGVILEDIEIKPSPKWMQDVLKTIGLKPINNVVDITNFVLHEYGQPLHAFDMNAISSNKIVVESGFENQQFITLDQQKLSIHEEDLMITNGSDLMAMGGVYGGATSGVNENTTSIFLECAYFLPNSIRKSSVRHQLRTDAALHFEKGVPFHNIIPAIERAVYLLSKYANAKVNSPFIQWEKEGWDQYRTLTLKDKYLNSLTGSTYDAQKVSVLFEDLGFKNVSRTEEGYQMEVHESHLDMHGPADLVEEVIRIDGLNAIPMPDQIQIPLKQVNTQHSRMEKAKVAALLTGQGYYEIMTNSLVNGKDFEDRKDTVPLLNSLSQGLNILRPEIMPSGLEAVAYNLNRQQDTLRFFEFGKTYHQPKVGIYTEKESLAIWATGFTVKDQWNKKNEKLDFFTFKKDIENILDLLDVNLNGEAGEGNEWLWKIKKKEVARILEVDTTTLKQFDIKQPVFFAIIDWKTWVSQYQKQNVLFQELPKYPRVERDLSLVLDQSVSYVDVEKVIVQKRPEMLLNYHLFDQFSADSLGENKKALAIKFTFQLNERTLTDAEVDQYMQTMMNQFSKQLDAIIRK